MDTAYFDNAATTFPKPEEVYRFMDEFYRTNGVNIGRGQYALASSAADIAEETRILLKELFHCPSQKVVFTPSDTISLNIILQGMNLRNGANIYITPFEHNAVTRTLAYLKTKRELNIIQLAVDRKRIRYDLDSIGNQFRSVRPDLVIVNHASNTCGIIAPVIEICSLAKKYNAITVIDMAQSAGLIDVDLSGDIYDFTVFAGHKTLYGPFGIAGFITTNTVKIAPLVFGGTGFDSANQSLPETTPEKFEVGSPNTQAIAGLYAALQWNKKIGIGKIYAEEQKNRAELVNILSKYDNIKMILPNDPCVGVVSCVFDNYSSDSMGNVLNRLGVAVRTGLHCSPYSHRFLGTFPEGTVRFSVGYFTSENDFAVLSKALSYISENA